MSPSSLRRYRAERLLREEFRSLRTTVIASVRGSLRASGARLDQSDLEACYSQAWHGLYAATLEGQRVHNPSAWLTVVTYRRAIDEHRARARVGLGSRVDPPPRGDGGPQRAARSGVRGRAGSELAGEAASELDVAGELDQRRELRELFEGLRLTLGVREQQAAALCYLQGLSRAEAARAMGVSDARMRKLMEGRGSGRPGVASKMAALLQTISEGGWCEEQGSLMRGFAYGILDPAGARYRLALAHTSACPSCRAYVASLRGLAALLPPVPVLLHSLLAGGVGAKAASGAGAKAAGGAGAKAAGGVLPASGAISSGAAASGAAGAAGGGWLLVGGGAGAKLAAGCLLALGVGAGCAVLGISSRTASAPAHAHARLREQRPARTAGRTSASQDQALRAWSVAPATTARAASAAVPAAATRASREFGLEQRAGSPGLQSRGYESPSPSPPVVSSRRTAVATASRAGREFAPAGASARAFAPAAQGRALSSSSTSAAQREFSPG